MIKSNSNLGTLKLGLHVSLLTESLEPCLSRPTLAVRLFAQACGRTRRPLPRPRARPAAWQRRRFSSSEAGRAGRRLRSFLISKELFSHIGVLLRALLFGVSIGARDFGKLPKTSVDSARR